MVVVSHPHLDDRWLKAPLLFFSAKLLRLGRGTKRLVQMLADGVLVVACFWLAIALRLENLDRMSNPSLWVFIIAHVPLTLAIFHGSGLYRSILRFIGTQVLGAVALGAAVTAVMMFASSQFLDMPVPRSVPGIFAVLFFLAAGALRFLARAMLRAVNRTARIPVAIYGAGEAGRQLENALHNGKEYLPLVFFDDDPALQNTVIGGRRVYAPSQIARIVRDLGISTILLALPSASRARRREILESLSILGLSIKTIPGIADIISGRATVSELREVQPEDLLGRDAVPPRADLMGRNITGKVVMVTGAGGSIGSELCRQIVRYEPAMLVLVELSEFALYSISNELTQILSAEGWDTPLKSILGSVQDNRRMREVLTTFGVQTVYHAAAYKHVVMVEENIVEGIRNNVFGTQVVAEAAAAAGVESFILISTDKAVRPTNFMGASKRMAELVCQSLARSTSNTTFSMVRFGNVLGSSGSVIPRFRSQIEKGGPVTVTHPEITRYFMTIPEAAQLVIQAGAMARGGDVFVLDMGEPVRILDLAESMIRLHGLRPYILLESEAIVERQGDIAITFVGLNKGEKLYEELLIGSNPMPTEHPRIKTATELSLPGDKLSSVLRTLDIACQAFDLATVRKIFLDTPLDYRPNDQEIHDVTWNARKTQRDDADQEGQAARLVGR